MEQFIDVNDLGVTLVLAVQAFFVLFWIISPIMGAIMAKAIENRTNSAMALGAFLLVFNLTFVGMTYFIRKAIPEERLSTTPLNLLSIVGALALALIVGRYVLWVLTPPPLPSEDFDTYEGGLLPFEERKRERLEKKLERRQK